MIVEQYANRGNEMGKCVCACARACVCVHIYIYMYGCAYRYVHVYVRGYVYACHVKMYVDMYVYACARVYIGTYLYIKLCIGRRI